MGHRPEVILAGRRINDEMGAIVARKLVKMMLQAGNDLTRARVGILGLTFKENVPDLRNSKVFDIIAELREFGISPLVHDPFVSQEDALREHGVGLTPLNRLVDLDGLILAVNHQSYVAEGSGLANRLGEGAVIIDVKSVLEPHWFTGKATYWSL